MKFLANCRFLKLEIAKSKKNNKEYGVLFILDDDSVSHKFYVFDELKNKFLNAGLDEFQTIVVAFAVSEKDDSWKVDIENFEP